MESKCWPLGGLCRWTSKLVTSNLTYQHRLSFSCWELISRSGAARSQHQAAPRLEVSHQEKLCAAGQREPDLQRKVHAPSRVVPLVLRTFGLDLVEGQIATSPLVDCLYGMSLLTKKMNLWGHLGGSVGEASSSWLLPRSWSQGHRIKCPPLHPHLTCGALCTVGSLLVILSPSPLLLLLVCSFSSSLSK